MEKAVVERGSEKSDMALTVLTVVPDLWRELELACPPGRRAEGSPDMMRPI
jgi:hypothetical protein